MRRIVIGCVSAALLLIGSAAALSTPGAGIEQFGDRGSLRFNETSSRAAEQITAQHVIGLPDGGAALPTIVETASVDGSQSSAAFRLDRVDAAGNHVVGGSTNLGSVVNASVADANGKWVWVVGTASGTSWRVWRFTIDGTIDITWGASGSMVLDVSSLVAPGYGSGVARDEAVGAPDGGLYVRSGKIVFAIDGSGALRTSFGQSGRLALFDRSFDGFPSEVAMTVDDAGRLITSQFYMKGRDGICVHLTAGARARRCPKPTPGAQILRVRRFNAIGQPDATFAGDAGTRVVVRRFSRKTRLRPAASLGLATMQGGQVLAQLDQTTLGEGIKNESRLVRLTATGTLDSAFGGDGIVVQHLDQPVVMGIAPAPDPLVDADGRAVLIRPSLRDYGAEVDLHLTRLRADGSIDPSWDRHGVAWLDSDRARVDEESLMDATLAPDGSILILNEATYLNGQTGWWQTLSKLDGSGVPGIEQTTAFSAAAAPASGRSCQSGRSARCHLPEGPVTISGFVSSTAGPRAGTVVNVRGLRRLDEGYWKPVLLSRAVTNTDGRFVITLKPSRIRFGTWRLIATAPSDSVHQTSNAATTLIGIGPRWALDAQDDAARARALIELAVENIDLNSKWTEDGGVTSMCQTADACARGDGLLRRRLVDGRRARPGRVAFKPGRPLGVYRLSSRIAPAGHNLDFIVTYDRWGDSRSTCRGDRNARRLLCPNRNWHM